MFNAGSRAHCWAAICLSAPCWLFAYLQLSLLLENLASVLN